jgi:hypothetical protein
VTHCITPEKRSISRATDGATNAENQIRQLRRNYSGAVVQQYLSTIASQPEAKQKMGPYFDKTTPEAVN